MANEFSPQLSKAQMQKSGVVDNASAISYQIGADLLRTGKKEFGEYQVRNLNEEINKELTNSETLDSEESTTLKSFNDEIGMELMREQQGVTNQQQKAFNINKAAADAKARAPWMADQIDKTVASKLGMTGAQGKTASSASDLKSQTQIAKKNLMKQREELSLKYFGTSSTKLNEEQYKELRAFERSQVSNQMEEVALKTEQLAFDRAELDDKKLDEVNEDNSLRINRVADTSFVSLNNIITQSLSVDNITEDNYNKSMALFKMQGNELMNKVTSMYANAGMPVDQNYLDAMQKKIDNTEKNFGIYKSLTLEEKRRIKLNDLSKMADINDKMTRSTNQNLTSLNTKLNLLERKSIKNMFSTNNKFARETAVKYHGKDFATKYTNEDGYFDGQSAVADLTNVQQFSGYNLEKQFGELKAMDLNIQAAKTSNFGLSNTATNLMLEGENKDPQTDSIVYISDKQTQRADEAVNYSGKASTGLPFIESNLKMINSNNYSAGNPNTEISAYRAEQVNTIAKTSASYITKAISENPDSIEIVNGEVISSDEAVMRSVNELYKAADKFKNIPNARAKILENITQIKVDSIENNLVKPMRDEITKEVNSNPLYSSLSPAEKDELIAGVVQDERAIQQAEALKLRQAGKVEAMANQIGEASKYNNSGVRTLFGNVNKLIGAGEPSTIEDKMKAAAYIGLSTGSFIDKVSGNVEMIGRKLFGDSLAEKTEEAYDVKLGLPRHRATNVKQVAKGNMKPELAKRLFDQMLPLQDELEMKQGMGTKLTEEEQGILKYYNKFTDSYNKMYEGRSLSDTVVRSKGETPEPTTTEDTTNMESRSLNDTLMLSKTNDEKKDDMYNMTFNNEIGRGRIDSRELHLPSATSGVTIGPGYDLMHRDSAEIVEDLTSVGVPEQDAKTIAEGAGLTGEEAESFIDSNPDIEITDEQEKALFEKVVPIYESRASEAYDSFDIDGKPAYEDLPAPVKELLVDYSYNVGANKFPKFFTALVKGDKEEALAQYKRYTGGKPLGRRNKDTLKVLNAYDFTDLTQ